jgi:hypothetical protein
MLRSFSTGSKTLTTLAVALSVGVGVALIMPSTNASPLAGGPSAKSTVQLSAVNLLDTDAQAASADPEGWSTLLRNTLKTPNGADLMTSVALETGLLTKTTVQSKGGKKNTTTAEAFVEVRVLVDGEEAYPGRVKFDARTQTLSATLEGIIGGCLSIDDLTGAIVLDEDCVEPEEIELVLETMRASSFDFLYPNASSGDHMIELQARIGSMVSDGGMANAVATIGKGCLSVESARLIKDEDILVE